MQEGPSIRPVNRAGPVLPPTASSVAAARRFVEEVLSAAGLEEPGWTATQLVSELATNAVIHARTEFVVEVSQTDHTVRVEVHDFSPAVPAQRRYGEESTTGRGLRLVDTMAGQWGVLKHGKGKTVWFEIDLSSRSTAFTWDDGEEVDLDDLLDQFGSDEDLGGGTRAMGASAWTRTAPVALLLAA